MYRKNIFCVIIWRSLIPHSSNKTDNIRIHYTSDHSPSFHFGHWANSTHFLIVTTLAPGHSFSFTISIPLGVSFSQCTLLTCVPSSHVRLHGDHAPTNHLYRIEKVLIRTAFCFVPGNKPVHKLLTSCVRASCSKLLNKFGTSC